MDSCSQESPRRVNLCALQEQHTPPAHSVASEMAVTLSSTGTGTQRRLAASSSEVAAYVTRVLKEDVSIAPLVCVLPPLPVTSVLTQGTMFG